MRIIPIREAYFEWRGWVAHKERAAGHVWDTVGIGMGIFE